MGGHIGAAHQSVYLLALTQLGTAGGVAILQARRAQNGPREGAGLQPALRQTLEAHLVAEGGAGPLRQILPAVATAERGDQQQPFQACLLHGIDHMTVALIVHRHNLTETAEGRDNLCILPRSGTRLLHRNRIQRIPLDHLNSQRLQFRSHLGAAHQRNDPMTLSESVVSKGAAQPAAGSENQCGWHS